LFNPLAPKLLAELIGTFAFEFIGAGTAAIVGQSVGLPGIATIAFAHGLTIMVFVFAYGAVSGGHFNPAVTIGVLAAGAMRAGEAIGYVISQLVGGVIGAFFLAAVLGGTATGLGTPALAHDLALGHATVTITPATGFVIEAVLAFFLVTVVLATAVGGRAGNLAPLAIGITLTLNIMMGGPLTSAPGARPNDRDGRSQQCLALCRSPDCRRTRRCHRAHGYGWRRSPRRRRHVRMPRPRQSEIYSRPSRIPASG
jgi:glycerol uptake facilitator-like aquaporin